MNILAIETSCDDTCAAIIRASGKSRPRFDILSNIVSSQVEVHKKWGGVYPTLAKREHQKNLPLVLEKALKKAKNPKINLIAVTIGPGLDPCLWVGVNFAKALSCYWDLPIVAVNHIEGHIVVNFIDKVQNSKFKTQNFPAIALVVSGGHTQLILMKDFGNYKILGETRDDAAGECLDKVAKILGLEYPGGPAIATEAKAHRDPASVSLPRPMIKQKNYDFSFSGLKTAVLYNFKTQPRRRISTRFSERKSNIAKQVEISLRGQPQKVRKSKEYIREMCKETQQAIIDVLIKKTIKAAKDYKAESIILGGGVSANKELRKQFQQRIQKEKLSFRFQVPSFKFCTDNAVMIGIAGYYNYLDGKTKKWNKVKADANLRIK